MNLSRTLRPQTDTDPTKRYADDYRVVHQAQDLGCGRASHHCGTGEGELQSRQRIGGPVPPQQFADGDIGDVSDVNHGDARASDRHRIDAISSDDLLDSQVVLHEVRRTQDCWGNIPEATFEVVSDDRVVDLVEEQFDVSIRVSPAPDSSLVGRCFARDLLVVVAAPSVPMPGPGVVQPVPAIVFANF